MNWEDCRELLKEAHEEPVAPAHYAAVRARVMAELERRERPLWARAWVWAAAAAMAAAVIVGVQVDLRPQLEPPVVALAYPPAPVVVRAATRPVVTRRPVTARRAKAEPLLIKMETDDPDVVIYWIAETGGED
jgi:hypothetical protein